jgi:hypothetical protein
MGMPHGDEPVCVSPALRTFKIKLNDIWWSSPQARAKGMRRLALVQLGSAGVLDDAEFAKRLGDLAIRVITPFALRQAASVHPDELHKTALIAAAKRCEDEGTIAAAYAAANAADAAKAATYAAKASTYAAADEFLSFFAEKVVQILIDMKAPGAVWLDLAPIENIAA